MRHSSLIVSVALLSTANSATRASVISSPVPNATMKLAPRQSGISALECILQGSQVECCQTLGLLSALASIIEPILDALGIPLPGLGTLVAFDCSSTVLGLGCTESTLCCPTVIPSANIGVGCEPVDSLL